MPIVRFLPQNVEIEVDADCKILVAARRAKVNIRFGCASCRCGTCAVKIDAQNGQMSEITAEEASMLERLKLNVCPEARMSCKSRVLSGTVEVDLGFQDQYDVPDEFEEI